jgi:hypothetical protein
MENKKVNNNAIKRFNLSKRLLKAMRVESGIE